MSEAKAGCVEVYAAADYLADRGLWGDGGVLLHELSHALHDQACGSAGPRARGGAYETGEEEKGQGSEDGDKDEDGRDGEDGDSLCARLRATLARSASVRGPSRVPPA